MENKKYNILWIDDQYESMSGFKGGAKFNNIHLIPYKSLNGGISELKKNYPYYDGVLLDAKFFENEDDVKGSEDTDNVHRAKEQMLQLPKKFEVFVLTGQAEAFDDKTFKKAFKNVYRKGNDEDEEQLFIDIKNAADQSEDTQIRHEYSDVFDVCTERYIGEIAGQDILKLLSSKGLNSIDQFNQIRKVVEDLFMAFNKYELLPSEFVSPSLAINPSKRFLCGEEQGYNTKDKYKEYKLQKDSVLPKQITKYLDDILSVTQEGSHRLSIDEHVNQVKTSYLLKSTLYQLMDVLVWFKMYVDSNPIKSNWTESKVVEPEETVYGTVINSHNEKGFAFFKPDTPGENAYIHPRLVKEFILENELQIEVELETFLDNRTKEEKLQVKRIIQVVKP